MDVRAGMAGQGIRQEWRGRLSAGIVHTELADSRGLQARVRPRTHDHGSGMANAR